MKIMYINATYKQGSHGMMVSHLHQHMKHLGHQSYVCYGRGKKVKEKGVYKIASSIEVKMHALLTRLTGFHGFFSPFSTFKLKRLIKTIKPEIIHIHELHPYYLNMDAVIKYIKKQNIKTYFTFHSEMMFTGKCGVSQGCNKFEETCNHCPLVKEYPKSLLFDQVQPMHQWRKKAFRDFNNLTIIAPSQFMINQVKRSFLKEYPVIHLQNGIDESNFLKSYNRPHQKNYVLAVANKIDFDPIKGFNDLVILAKRLEKHEIDVVVIGTILKHKHMPKNLILIERTNNQQILAAYYQHAKYLIVTSKSENQPLTIIEAFMSKTKVLAYNVGGIKEMADIPMIQTVPYGKILLIEALILSEEIQISETIAKTASNPYTLHTFIKNHEKLYFKQ
jgi:putative colanic acid biosynthesis glycosyltransferase